MRPYTVEGLDCSGKKTITRLVQERLQEQGLRTNIVIGPLIGGGLGRLDARLASITTAVRRGSPTDLLRRSLYVAEPVLDRLFHRPGPTPVLKVSTHFRAWARAGVEHDRWMAGGYNATRSVHVRYAGATLLATDFDVRLARHRADVAAGRTTKVEHRRFFGPDPEAFTAWHDALDRLMSAHIPHVLRLDSTTTDPADLAERIALHAATCWEADR
ncbi:hypothetical protein ACFV7Q_25430 [Streptomyces sp. NPDC059851]|uniref:hypothetical protein n=1 Tax=Streptomyces sp. NPDC059851 TaxID=3346971 RepID=UPI00364AE5A3